MQPIRAVIADDHPVVLVGVSHILRGTGGIEVVCKAPSVARLFAALRTLPCDVLVTDYRMPNTEYADGEAMLSRIRREWPDLPIVLLTMAANVIVLQRARRLGILALVEKGAGIGELPQAITAALAGRTYVSSSLRQRLAEAEAYGDLRSGAALLSVAERRVAQMFSAGDTVTQIAQTLSRSVATVSRQKNAAMRKLGASNNIELADAMRKEESART